MDLGIDFENWGYSDDERERARAAVSEFVENAHGPELWGKLPTIAAWYAQSPYAEDVEQLLDVFLTRLYREYDLLPTAEDEALSAGSDNKRLDNTAVESILQCVANDIPTWAIASFADTVKHIAGIANQYLGIVAEENMLYLRELNRIASRLAGVAGFVDYFTGGNAAIRSDAVDTLAFSFFDDKSVHAAFAESFARGLMYDRTAHTLHQRLPWLRWFFDEIPKDGFWRSVFTIKPYPLAQGFLHMVWETDAPFADWERAMWYHRLARLAESGVEWDADDVLRMGREPELMAKLLCGEVANTR